MVVAGDLGAGAQPDDLGDHDVGGGVRGGDAEQGEQGPAGEGAAEGRGDPEQRRGEGGEGGGRAHA